MAHHMQSNNNHNNDTHSTFGTINTTLDESPSQCFWDPGCYKKTTKRIDDGYRLCNDLVQLIQERCDIEKNYAKSLSGWSKKWNECISNGPEYGTTEAAWKSVLSEADKRHDLHLKIKDKLTDTVIADIKQWQKEKFHKTMMHIKEKREMDEEFKKAQKPWAKMLARVNKCKADYHTACKNERTLTNQERNANSDTSLSPDQVRKLQARVAKCKEEVQKTKERYEEALETISQYNQKYVDEMTIVFEKFKDFEEKRLIFFKDILFSIHSCLNISTDPELPQIYEEYRHTIQNADASKDLKWWTNNHGIGMPMSWPQFEPFSEEFRDIIKDGKTKKTEAIGDGIMLINQHKFNEELPVIVNDSNRNSSARIEVVNSIPNNNNNFNSSNSNRNSTSIISCTNNNNNNNVNNSSKNVNIDPSTVNSDDTIDAEVEDEDEDWDDGEPGVPVRALYDYDGAESDELSFKQGDVFEKLEDEDEQGWCKGRKANRVGLYPANYVELIAEKI
ncbi:Protein kinase C and casein kinase substrate in neurons protein 2 [Fragariocoptes setiger]|uniref:Protein kinase C and casein kinase substrate in neurons protein 2 n=1 Tax=Fragariocoptes setiger TaxID=1670756 RepID=A0ABQ7SC38_9ACAR|nr:Protein kinase C and casein kinase substrate in neurons protein 2 [Fragariocoptes setiger]